MKGIWVAPVEDRLIQNPDNNFLPVEEPTLVPNNTFWRLAIADGDLTKVSKEDAEKQLEAIAAKRAEAQKAEREAEEKAEREAAGGNQPEEKKEPIVETDEDQHVKAGRKRG